LSAFQIQPLTEDDRDWLAPFLTAQWGSVRQAIWGRVIDVSVLPGFVAVRGPERVGLITYRIEKEECEVTTLNSTAEGIGVGTALLESVREVAEAAGCRRLALITTNDNLHALRFYQRRGWTLAALYPNSLAAARRLKPEIPEVGRNGIPLRDEIELELRL
jgi:GNAT superfamily N-acetyltransferase